MRAVCQGFVGAFGSFQKLQQEIDFKVECLRETVLFAATGRLPSLEEDRALWILFAALTSLQDLVRNSKTLAC